MMKVVELVSNSVPASFLWFISLTFVPSKINWFSSQPEALWDLKLVSLWSVPSIWKCSEHMVGQLPTQYIRPSSGVWRKRMAWRWGPPVGWGSLSETPRLRWSWFSSSCKPQGIKPTPILPCCSLRVLSLPEGRMGVQPIIKHPSIHWTSTSESWKP